MAFFPCVRFEAQIIMCYKGDAFQMSGWSDLQKLESSMKLQKELVEMYQLISKMTCVCIKKKIRLIIENPYNTQHYLTRYWCIKPKLIDQDRTTHGDKYVKPTQYWFINCEPKENIILEPMANNRSEKNISDTHNKTERSKTHPDYARFFIRSFIL